MNIKKFSVLTFLVGIFCFLSLTKTAHATLVWDFNFVQDSFIVGPNDSIDLFAVLHNDSTAGETIAYLPINTADWSPALVDANNVTHYGFGFAPNFFTQFNQFINPGETFNFHFGTYTPLGGGPVPEGRYTAFPENMDLVPRGGGFTSHSSLRTVTWCVDNDGVNPCPTEVPSNPVPEPASMLLFGSGAFGALLRRRFSHR